MIRPGYKSESTHAISSYKQIGKVTAGFALAGFGTEPTYGEISDDSMKMTVDYAAHHIQVILGELVEKEFEDLKFAGDMISRKMKKLNDSLCYINRRIGRGNYLAGTICYIAGENFICLPFGGGYACLWDMEKVTPLTNKAVPGGDTRYIWDALGGCLDWKVDFDTGTIPVGTQLICATSAPPAQVLEKELGYLTHIDPTIVSGKIHDVLAVESDIPAAVLSLNQAVPGDEEDNDTETDA